MNTSLKISMLSLIFLMPVVVTGIRQRPQSQPMIPANSATGQATGKLCVGKKHGDRCGTHYKHHCLEDKLGKLVCRKSLCYGKKEGDICGKRGHGACVHVDGQAHLSCHWRKGQRLITPTNQTVQTALSGSAAPTQKGSTPK